MLLLEDKSYVWMTKLNMSIKLTYRCEQCGQIELLYADTCMNPIQREVTRVNRIPVLFKSEDSVTFDWMDELYNY